MRILTLLNILAAKLILMKWFGLIVFIVLFQSARAQQNGAAGEPPYKKNPHIPELNLLQVDSTILSSSDLKKNQNTIIMYFSPSCDHCIHQMDEMMGQLDALKHFQIIMATYQPFEEMELFYKKYKLADLHNFKLGRDTKFQLPPFYIIRSLPYFALYDKKGNLVTTFDGNVKVEALVKAFSKKNS